MDEHTSTPSEFVAQIQALPPGPGVSLDDVLKPSIAFESDLRKLFATDRNNTRLADPYVGLIDLFNAPDAIRTTRARVVQNDEDASKHYVLPLSDKQRRPEGAPCVVPDLDEFKSNWAIFTEGSLSQLKDWNNIVAAGGSVLACLAPLTEETKESKRNIRELYHTEAYPTSDIDLFLWGLNAEQAEDKIKKIFKAVRDSVPWDVTCVRTKHTVSIQSQYPYRSVQIVLRLYHSPAEVLAGFDIDAPSCLYDGNAVWANPRSIVAMMRQCNTIDMSRRSPSYEVRLAKYAKRGFEVYVPDLRRQEVDPTIYERSIARMDGLARLLVLEKLKDTDTRYAFLESRRALRNRPDASGRQRDLRRIYKGDLKAKDTIAGLEQNDYDVQNLHIPYGPGWDARRIEKLIYQTDLGMNSTFNPKNKKRRLHRHPAFFGTFCPDPIDEDEKKLQESESEKYIRGRIAFIEENPGRQSMTGSFNPIDEGEWQDQAYIKPTQQLFAAIVAHDRETVNLLIKDLDVNQRDHVGRTSLHVAILCRASAIACDLIEAGARITARLVDGRAPLHLACQYDLPDVITALFKKSALNEAEEKLKNPDKADGDVEMADKTGKGALERPSSEDDWSSHSDDDIDMVDKAEVDDEDQGDDDDGDDDDGDDDDGDDEDENDEDEGDDEGDAGSDGSDHPEPERTPSPAPPADLPEDELEEPDIIDVNLLDWDCGFPPLAYAVIYGSLATLDILLSNKADIAIPTKPFKQNYYSDSVQLHPIELSVLRDDEDEACKVVERLIAAGASCTTANQNMWTGFHSIVAAGKVKILNTILNCDKNAVAALNFPSVSYRNFTFPIVSAIKQKNYGALAMLVSYGAKLEFDEADIIRAQEASTSSNKAQTEDNRYVDMAYQPVETALWNQDDVVQLLFALGAPINLSISEGVAGYKWNREAARATLLDWVTRASAVLTKKITWNDQKIKNHAAKQKALPKKPTWKQALERYQLSLKDNEALKNSKRSMDAKALELKDTKAYIDDVKRLLVARGAKSWGAVFPDLPTLFRTTTDDMTESTNGASDRYDVSALKYYFVSKDYSRHVVPDSLKKRYDDLYAACFAGDDKKVEKMCRPPAGSKDKALLISVYLSYKDWGTSEGYTPLFAAMMGQRWTTVKLILSIVTSQYKPVEKNKKFDTNFLNVVEDDLDSDYDSDSGTEGYDTEKEKPTGKVLDIASHVATSDISPRRFLDVPCEWRVKELKGTDPLLVLAIMQRNVEAFTQLADLYQGLSEKDSKLDKQLTGRIVSSNCPEILDLYIRRTGMGIELTVPEPADGKSDIPIVVNDANKLYLGLNVRGKKRKDLATRHDPNAVQDTNEPPMVWQAAKHHAKEMIEYLASDRPLAAYQHYANTHTDTRAMVLRRHPNLEKDLSTLLGWSINSIGESPLTAALVGADLDTFELLMTKSTELMKSALSKKIKYVGYNLLMLAVRLKNPPKVIDALLSRSLDATVRDTTRGWNIYHHVCSTGNVTLLRHLLEKLPREVNEMLLRQQSKDRYNTPLHVAIPTRIKTIISAIVDYDPVTLTIRNVHGRLPIHNAVTKSYHQIVQYMLSKSDPTVLQAEDGVGNTVVDIACLVELRSRTNKIQNSVLRDSMISPTVGASEPVAMARYLKDRVAEMEREIGRLREAVEFIAPVEKKKRRTKILWEVNMFIALLEKKLKEAKDDLPRVTQIMDITGYSEEGDEDYEDDDEDEDDEGATHTREDLKIPKEDYDEADSSKTFNVVMERKRDLSVSSQRQLIHVSHVQKSVVAGLDIAAKKDDKRRKEKDEFHETEEDPEEAERKKSMVFGLIDIKPDEVE